MRAILLTYAISTMIVCTTSLWSFALQAEARQLDEIPFAGLDEKIVDEGGKGPPNLQSLINLRAVLPSRLFRSGVRISPKSAISVEALKQLCEAGMTEVYYLYSGPLPQNIVTCFRNGQLEQIRYKHALVTRSNVKYQEEVLAAVHALIVSDKLGVILLHDWAGLHAAGYISAIVLRQFCEFSPSAAQSYWRRTADGKPIAREAALLRRIEAFQPNPAWTIPIERQASVCPSAAA